MQFRIADTFTGSLAKLTGNEQKAVKTAAFDLQLNPAQPGLRLHKLDGARDANFWSVRVNRDIRIIVHRTGSSLMLCYADHHENAYQWAERRKLETHPKTGAAQLVEVRETVQEIVVPAYAPKQRDAPPKPLPFANIAESDLLNYGVPSEWLNAVRKADEDSFLELAEHLPGEAAEALLVLAAGETPRPAVPVSPTSVLSLSETSRPAPPPAVPDPFEHPAIEALQPLWEAAPPPAVPDPFEHPDAQRRFRTMRDAAELERALEYPWEKWAVFLHPEQRQAVEKGYAGPARVCGSAGTGKTIAALHRAVHLARVDADARVLLTTFSDTLAAALRAKLRLLLRNEPRLAERVEVEAIDAVGERLYRARFGPPKIAARELIGELLAEAAGGRREGGFGPRFLLSEWEDIVDAWQLDSWQAYRDVRRLGRKTRLPVERRAALWAVFEKVKAELRERGLTTRAAMFGLLAAQLEGSRNPPFAFAVVDEAQDVGVSQLRFLAALGGGRPNSLFFAGDPGQRIFRTPFSWKALGVDVRGRSQTLKLNYRTSHQIRMQADRLLGPEVADVDGNVEERRGTVSAFNGEPPEIRLFATEGEESEAVAAWLQERRDEGAGAHEIGVFVRSEKGLDRARAAARGAGLPFRVLDERARTDGGVSLGTMHLAKGLEFRAVAVMACDEGELPLQERIAAVADDADLEDVYDTERRLLYVACTRARDHLSITGVEPASEFLDDLRV